MPSMFEIQRDHAEAKARQRAASSRVVSNALKGAVAASSGPIDDDDTLIDPAAAAKILDVTENRLAKWRCTGEGPAFIKFGRRVKYRRGRIRAFIAERERISTSATAPPAKASDD